MGGDQSSASPTPTPFHPLFRPPSDNTGLYPADDIENNFRARIINDILRGKINLDQLRQFQDNMGSQDKSLPNMQYFRPMA